nr:DUF3300 domain-containing protein [Geminicoccaceae bacterium]
MKPWLFLALAALLAGSGTSVAQQAPASDAAATPAQPAADQGAAEAQDVDPGDFADESLDVLLAPVAMLPDPLLVAVLQSSIVPVDVIAASQFLDAYETDKTLQPNPAWDPAVIGLLGFPTILRAMADNMDWVEATGDAVLGDLDGVQASIQQDRAEFHAAGVLKSDDKQNVIVDADTIRVEPVDPKVIYLPIYDAAQLMDAIRSGDASIATQPPAQEAAAQEAAAAPGEAAPAPQGDTAGGDAAARAEAAAQEAKDAAAASQQASGQSQAAAEQSQAAAQQSQAAADQSQAAASEPPPQAVAEAPASSVALPADQAAPMAYAPPPVTYAAPVTYAPPVAYADTSSSSVWTTVGTFAGGALVGGLLGYALGDDDDDDDHYDGWWDDDDDIDIDEDDLDDYLDDRRRDREDAREDWQGFADDAREDRQSAASDRQQNRQDTAGDRQQT